MANTVAQIIAKTLEAKNIRFELLGDNQEAIRTGTALDNAPHIKLLLVVDEDEKSFNMKGYDFIKVPADKIDRMYKAVNELNTKLRWIKFYVDEKDLEITAECDAVIDLDTCGAEAWELICRMVGIVDRSIETLQRGLWA